MQKTYNVTILRERLRFMDDLTVGIEFDVDEIKKFLKENPELVSRKVKPKINVDPRFFDFWNEYPRRVAKANAMQAWDRLLMDDDFFNLIMSALKKAKRSWSDIKYIPHPASWLNAERWNDEIVDISKPAKDSKYLDNKYAGL